MHLNRLFESSWPEDLDPATVPFKGRSKTVLRRRGFYDDWSLFDELTAVDVLSWWYAGPATVKDVQTAGNEGIRHHHETVDVRRRIEADLAAVALEPWTSHVWHRDPRFTRFVPKGDSTVHDIATSGTALERRALWDHLYGLRSAVEAQGALSLPVAVSEYIEAVSGQHGKRLDVLLAVTGLNGLDLVTVAEGARRLDVSRARVYQIVGQMQRRLAVAQPRHGAWLPQLAAAEETGWPDEYAEECIEAIGRTFASQGP